MAGGPIPPSSVYLGLTSSPSGNDILNVAIVFNTSGWTLAQVSTWQAYVIWE